ncbi:MAG: hypothetical protein WCI22_00710 [Actinomycetota bacterium]
MTQSRRSLDPGQMLWALRVVWVLAGLALALAVSRAAHSLPGGFVGSAAAYLMVGLVVVALVVPSPDSLTVCRMLVPASVPAAAVAWASSQHPAAAAVAIGLTVVSVLLALSGEVGEALVQGTAYGDERRFPLRTPAAILVPAFLSWALWCAAALSAVVLLCNRRWVAGAVLCVAAVALTWLVFTRLSRLSNRWLVLVPAGLVVRDPLILGETLMVQRTNLASVHLAPANTEAADLTGPAGGVPVEVVVRDMITALFPASSEHPRGRAIHVQSFLVSPVRPGRALHGMAQANLPVG